jgi:hypothetical protein
MNVLEASMIACWNIVGALHNPKGMTMKMNAPHSVINVVFF